MTRVPAAWYNLLADLPFDLPPDLPPPAGDGRDGARATEAQLPKALVRHTMTRDRDVPIPDPVRDAYAMWRPTTLRRALQLEQALGTRARIYYKYEGSNASGSHKLNTAVAQAHYYGAGGIDRLVTGTGAGQWGTAVAVAAHMFGMGSAVYMVAISYRQKPYRRTMMQLFGADVAPSPSDRTRVGRSFLAGDPEGRGNIALSIAEALEDAGDRPGSRFCIGSGEVYSLLHQTVIGIEARDQLAALGEWPDVVVASVGAGSNFGGICFPFLGDRLRTGRPVRCVAVEPSSCPKLTRGVYAYDYTDYSGVTPLEKMYTLGSRFVTPDMHAGGLRYHATSKLVSALYHHGLIEAQAYRQTEVLEAAALFCRSEGILPAPEAAHAVRGALDEARRADDLHEDRCILICLSGHGHFDVTAYADWLEGRLPDPELGEQVLLVARETLPVT